MVARGRGVSVQLYWSPASRLYPGSACGFPLAFPDAYSTAHRIRSYPSTWDSLTSLLPLLLLNLSSSVEGLDWLLIVVLMLWKPCLGLHSRPLSTLSVAEGPSQATQQSLSSFSCGGSILGS